MTNEDKLIKEMIEAFERQEAELFTIQTQWEECADCEISFQRGKDTLCYVEEDAEKYYLCPDCFVSRLESLLNALWNEDLIVTDY